jgi:hypothetical protein
MSGDTLGSKPKKSDDSRNDFSGICMDLIEKIPIKKIIYLILILLVAMNDVFIGEVLGSIKGSVEDDGTTVRPSTKGTMIQITFIVVTYIIMGIFADSGLL